jgi:hypothetical protein
MTKIYIIAPWFTGAPCCEWLKPYSPNNSGRWGSIECTGRFSEADYYIAMWCGEPYLRKLCRPASVINVSIESSRHIPPPSAIGKETVFSQWVTDHTNPVDWWVHKTYDELSSTPFPEKSKLVSAITTGRYIGWLGMTARMVLNRGREGHYYRMRFLKRFSEKYPGVLDLYGINSGGFDLSSLPCYKGPIENKWEGLAPYRYAFAFENTSEKNYFTEKLTDPILSGCMPLYYGCSNLAAYLPQGSFVVLDITKDDAVDRAMGIIHSDFREQNLVALERAKDLILNKYQFWPTIEEIVRRIEK